MALFKSPMVIIFVALICLVSFGGIVGFVTKSDPDGLDKLIARAQTDVQSYFQKAKEAAAVAQKYIKCIARYVSSIAQKIPKIKIKQFAAFAQSKSVLKNRCTLPNFHSFLFFYSIICCYV
jgi:hypothetical protein